MNGASSSAVAAASVVVSLIVVASMTRTKKTFRVESVLLQAEAPDASPVCQLGKIELAPRSS